MVYVLYSLALGSQVSHQASESLGGRALGLGRALDRAVDRGLVLEGRVGTGLLFDALLPGHEGLIAALPVK